MSDRVLITGCAGFAGRHLIEALRTRDAGTEIHGLDRIAAPDLFLDHMFAGDITDYARLRDVVAESRPDIVFHLAAVTFGRPADPEDRRFFDINVIGTRLLMEALLVSGLNPRVVVTGSSASYGAPPREKQPIDEDTPLRPQTLYAASKAAQELVALSYARAHGLPVMVTRAFNHTGPGEHAHFASSSFARQIAEIEAGVAGAPIRVGNLDAYRDLSDVRDVVRGYIAAVFEGEPGECYNVCSGVARKTGEVLATLIGLGGGDLPVEVDPERVQPSDVPYQCGSFAKLEAASGWRPAVPFERTLSDLLDDWRRRTREQAVATPPKGDR